MANDGQPQAPTDTQIRRPAPLRHRCGTPSKLVMRVRFPSPAPNPKPQVTSLSAGSHATVSASLDRGPGHARATGTAQASSSAWSITPERTCCMSPPSALAVGDGLVPVSGRMLIDQSGARARMAEPGHQLPDTGTRSCRKCPPDGSQILKVKPFGHPPWPSRRSRSA
jgi:hypothetical protein